MHSIRDWLSKYISNVKDRRRSLIRRRVKCGVNGYEAGNEMTEKINSGWYFIRSVEIWHSLLFKRDHVDPDWKNVQLCPWNMTFIINRTWSFYDLDWKMRNYRVSQNTNTNTKNDKDRSSGIIIFDPDWQK